MRRAAVIFTILAGLTLMFWGASIGFRPKPSPVILKKEIGYAPIVRLHDFETGRFFCSGTIISNKHLVTAAHCIEGATTMSPIEVRDKNGKSFDPMIVAFPRGANPRGDTAILEGRFNNFDKMVMAIKPNQVLKAFYGTSVNLVLCGYPYGGKLLCLPFKQPRQYFFQVQGISHVYPGMSGGPVIDLNTGKLVAVNTAATELFVIVSPTSEIFESIDVAP
jgi:S1-C subfamily serine protease